MGEPAVAVEAMAVETVEGGGRPSGRGCPRPHHAAGGDRSYLRGHSKTPADPGAVSRGGRSVPWRSWHGGEQVLLMLTIPKFDKNNS